MSEHIVSKSVYYVIFGALLVLTGITVLIAKIDLGAMNVIAALAIAFFKAILVTLYFMHIRYSRRLTQVVVAGGLFWFLILIGLTLSDYLTRGWFNPPASGGSIVIREGESGSRGQHEGPASKKPEGNDQRPK